MAIEEHVRSTLEEGEDRGFSPYFRAGRPNARTAFGNDCSMPVFLSWQMATYTKIHKVVQESNYL
jgi:hypothetical protein